MRTTGLDKHIQAWLLGLGGILIAVNSGARAAEPNDLRQTFEHHYGLWKAHCQAVRFSSRTADRLQAPDYKAIVRMGPQVLPYIFEKLPEDKDFIWIVSAWREIAQVSGSPSDNPWAKEPMEDWWQGGKSQSKARFETTYGKWKNLKRQGNSAEASHARATVRALGISVLPMLMMRLGPDDGEILDIIRDITRGAADTSGTTLEQRIESCKAWWNKDKEKWLIPFPNTTPVANAGQDRRVSSGNAVQLDASGSTDPDKDPLTYEWVQTAGSTVGLTDPHAAHNSFVAPQVDRPTILVFQLVVDDGSPERSVHPACHSGRSKPAVVKITVTPK